MRLILEDNDGIQHTVIEDIEDRRLNQLNEKHQLAKELSKVIEEVTLPSFMVAVQKIVRARDRDDAARAALGEKATLAESTLDDGWDLHVEEVIG